VTANHILTRTDLNIYPPARQRLGRAPAACLIIEDSLSAVARPSCENARAAILDRRFVNLREYEKEADYVLNDLSEIPVLIPSDNRRHVPSLTRNSWTA
jgi:beta-phosphoglucomutase-like phosphatase (HAD superfamily)